MRASRAVVLLAVVVALATAVPAFAAPPTRVRVVIRTFHYVLSRQRVPLGRAAFTVVNRTHLPMDFRINGVGATPILRPGQRYVLHVLFRRRGRYIYFGRGEYAEMGLYGELVVR